MNKLKEKYLKEVIPVMKEKFGYKNDMAVPKLTKVVVNVGMGQAIKDANFLEVVENTLVRITGQRPVKTKAKKSIAGFKIREGLTIGMMATLRGPRMYNFIYKLINVTLPRVRDFRGLSPKSLDNQGNLTIGIKEHVVFPEIKPDEVEKLHGLEVVVTTSAKNSEEGLELLRLLGFPLKEG